MKKVLSLVLALIMVFALGACTTSAPDASTAPESQAPASQAAAEAPPSQSIAPPSEAAAPPSEAAADPDKYKFAVVYGGVHPFFEPWEPGAKAAAKDLGIPEPEIASPQQWDQTEQNQVLDGLVAKGVKGIAMFPSDAVGGNEQITKMVDAGVNVVTMGGAPAEPSKAKFCYATDVGASIGEATQKAIDKLKENGKTNGNVVHLASGISDPNTQIRIKSVEEVVKKNNFTMFQTLPDTDNTEAAEKAISALFAANKEKIDIIVCSGYVCSQVLAKTMMEQNESRIVAIGIDDSKDVMDAIEKGIMYGTMPQNPWGMGYVGIYALKLLADGYTYKADAPFFLPSGHFFMGKDGLATYQQDIEKMTQ